jgi:hypothetical protein
VGDGVVGGGEGDAEDDEQQVGHRKIQNEHIRSVAHLKK